MLRIRIRIRIRTFLGLPDPLVRGTDPRIRIHTKMSRICNTARSKVLFLVFTVLFNLKTIKFKKIEKTVKIWPGCFEDKTWIRIWIQIEKHLYVALSWILMDFALNEVPVTIYPPLAFFLERFCIAGTVSYLWSARAVGWPWCPPLTSPAPTITSSLCLYLRYASSKWSNIWILIFPHP